MAAPGDTMAADCVIPTYEVADAAGARGAREMAWAVGANPNEFLLN